MADKKKTGKAPAGKPKLMKDGKVKWGNKTFANEKEFEAYMLKTAVIVDGKKKK